MSEISPVEFPGLPMKPPQLTPQVGQVIIGYEKFKMPADCCNCEGLNESGYIWLIALFVMGFVFLPIWFFACLPLCFENCRKEYQRPVYGNRGEGDSSGGVVGVAIQVQPQYTYPVPPTYATPAKTVV
eukprot:TRINITY_DN820_c0_g1_i10.p3 TRINITY_DN820_c0_g1~~TRINITY_DN820_c0_g1_i10.p3  ORF type:complete len:150 (+),score=21.92 TRINITY_DN820_c0_g1_i10:69-452(+)